MMALCAGSAHASGTIACVSDDGASVELTLASLPVLSVAGATIAAGEGGWTTLEDGDGQPVVVGQAARHGDLVVVDFTDPNIERIVAELRLLSATEEHDQVTAGTLRIAGQGAHALTCVGP
ncbi:hypothetical protein PZ895_09955 [Mesorhizobium sp. YIM 152430]|uniref:hypothetical protein n=1 Tax=Mesorhizobium sp. YIM 152430 TaxID=3031761 RepID=UPI0023DB76C7|nr:hypothetical protein [Mesorhizobium sp. YIM 152430]MDF1600101.1 hypothetical protein [Mesorhizobium sp. YIM 152430]